MECCNSQIIRTEESVVNDPQTVAYFEHPKTNKRYNVLYVQNELYTLDSSGEQQICVYYLENNNKVFYCEQYDGGKWIWESK
jgi:hypothetical protein